MKRWYLVASVVALFTIPSVMMAQTGGGSTGSSGSGSSTGGSRGTSSGSGSSSGLAGSANTTLLGNQVNLNFNSVFGTSATLANTTADNFAAYRPSGSGSSSGSSSSFSGGSGISNSGLGSGTGSFSGTGTGARTGTGMGGLSSGGMSGSLGTGGTSGGLGGNRGGLGGGLTSGGLGTGGLGGNRNMMGGGGFLGGTQGGMGMMGMNNQQNSTQGTMGYQVNFAGTGNGSLQGPAMSTLTPNVDFQQRLQSSPGMQTATGLQVFTRGDTAILRGQVGSDYAKQLAAAMIRLEPGVYEVQNELVVAPPKQ